MNFEPMVNNNNNQVEIVIDPVVIDPVVIDPVVIDPVVIGMNGSGTMFRLLSDLHLEFYDGKLRGLISRIQFTDKDKDCYLILAGDIGYPVRPRNPKYLPVQDVSTSKQQKISGLYGELLTFFRSKFKGVILVPGNHEYYLCHANQVSMNEVDDIIRSVCDKVGVIFLQKSQVVIDNVIVYGCTLFSEVTHEDSLRMNDIHKITSRHYIVQTHREHSTWLQSKLQSTDNENKRVLVITHYLPAKIRDNMSTGYYTNFIKDFIHGHDTIHEPTVWCCGHDHTPINTFIDNIQILSAPMGYKPDVQFTEPVYFTM